MYQDLYNLIAEHVFSNVLTDHAELVCTLVATIACLGFIALPFYLVIKICNMICR